MTWSRCVALVAVLMLACVAGGRAAEATAVSKPPCAVGQTGVVEPVEPTACAAIRSWGPPVGQ